jgi:hypothetical protein
MGPGAQRILWLRCAKSSDKKFAGALREDGEELLKEVLDSLAIADLRVSRKRQNRRGASIGMS